MNEYKCKELEKYHTGGEVNHSFFVDGGLEDAWKPWIENMAVDIAFRMIEGYSFGTNPEDHPFERWDKVVKADFKAAMKEAFSMFVDKWTPDDPMFTDGPLSGIDDWSTQDPYDY